MKSNLTFKFVMYFLGVSLVLVSLSSPAEAQTCTINLTSANQYIRGFGGMNFPRWIGDLTSAQVDKAFGTGAGQIGMTILRTDVPFDNTQWSQQVPAAVRAKSYGAIVFASPWSPPASMKSNNNIVDGSLNTSSYSAYASHLADFCNYMSSNGASLYAISIQNEPDITVDYESCRWTSTQMINFLTANASVIPTNVIVAESFQFIKSFTDPILNNTSAAAQVEIIGGHLYGGGLSDYPLARSKGKEVWMTEHLVNNTDWAGALATGKEIHDCMVANFNAYVWWYIRRSYGPIDESGNVTKRGYVMSQYTKFVRPGFTRVAATATPTTNVDVTAYKNGSDVIIVALNRNSSNVNVTFTLQNGTVGSFTKYTTSGSKNVNNDGSTNVSNGSFTASLDASSVITFVSSGTAAPTLSVTPTSLNVAAAANSTASFNITSNVSWTVTDDQTWLSVSPTSGSNNGTVTVTAQENTGASTRTAIVTVSGSEVASQTVTVTQAAAGGGTAINVLGSWVTGTSHTKESGRNRALILIAHGESTTTMNLSAVKYGGQAMTKAVEYNYNASSGYAYAAAFILNESGVAAASSSTISVTWSGTAPGSAGYSSVFLDNVDQSTSTGATGIGGSTSNPVTTSSSLATSSGDMVILGATCGNAGSYTLNNSFTEGSDQQIASTATGVTGRKSATGANETPSATYSSTINRQMIIGLVVKAGSGSTPTLSVSPTSLNVAAAANSTASFNVTSNTSWTVTDNQTWLSVSPTSGSNNGTVTVTAQENTNTTTRTATVTVSASGVTSQTVTVTQAAGSGGSTSVWLEAECGSVGSLWNIPTDATASNSRYVTIQSGNNSTTSAPTNTAGHITYSFTVSQTGTYRLFARVKCPTANDDSYWIKMDSGSWIQWNNITTTSWAWKQLSTTFSLGAGSHTLTVAYREDGAQLDKLNITTSTTTPTGTGETASNLCTPKSIGEGEIEPMELPNGFELAQSYPNPFNPTTVISFTIPENYFVSLKVYDLRGAEIAELAGREYPAGRYSITFDASNLASGIYFYTIKAGQYISTQRMIFQK